MREARLWLERCDGEQWADREARCSEAQESAQGDAAEPHLAVFVVEQGGRFGRCEHGDKGWPLVGGSEDERGEPDQGEEVERVKKRALQRGADRTEAGQCRPLVGSCRVDQD